MTNTLAKNQYDIIFFILILFIGFITSCEDFKTSKIRNKWIVLSLVYVFTVYITSWFLYYLFTKDRNNVFIGEVVCFLLWNFDKWCVNLVVSTIIAYLLWHFKMWGAGDAKLFIAYAALIPMAQYHKVYFNYYFASLLLLINIFIPATIFIFLKAILHFLKGSSLRKRKKDLTELMKIKINKSKTNELIKVLFGFFIFFLFFIILRQEFIGLVGRILPNRNILMLITLVAFRPLSKIFKKKSKAVLLFSSIFIFYIIFKIQSSEGQYLILAISALKKSVLIMLLFPVVTKIIHIYEENAIRKTTPFAFWMFLGVLITWFI